MARRRRPRAVVPVERAGRTGAEVRRRARFRGRVSPAALRPAPVGTAAVAQPAGGGPPERVRRLRGGAPRRRGRDADGGRPRAARGQAERVREAGRSVAKTSRRARRVVAAKGSGFESRARDAVAQGPAVSAAGDAGMDEERAGLRAGEALAQDRRVHGAGRRRCQGDRAVGGGHEGASFRGGIGRGGRTRRARVARVRVRRVRSARRWSRRR